MFAADCEQPSGSSQWELQLARARQRAAECRRLLEAEESSPELLDQGCPPDQFNPDQVERGALLPGLRSPPRMAASLRPAADIFQISPESAQQQCEIMGMAQPMMTQSQPSVCDDDMEMTPTVATRPQTTSPYESPHSALLERAKKLVEMAARTLNIEPSSRTHPLLYDSPTYASPTERPAQTARRLHQAGCTPPIPMAASASYMVEPRDRGVAAQRPLRTAGRQPPAELAQQCGPSAADTTPLRARQAAATRSLPQISQDTPRGRPPASRGGSQSRQQSLQAAIQAGTFRGTEAEMEAIGFRGERDHRGMLPEYEFADQYITPYQGPAPQVDVGAVQPVRGVMKRPTGAVRRQKSRVMLRRDVTQITIPPRPEPGMESHPWVTAYTYQPGDAPHGVRSGELLPPRRLTPSPPGTCYQEGYERTAAQLQSRRNLEADWERRQPAVPSREYASDVRPASKPRPKSYTSGKKHQYYRGGARSDAPMPTASTSFGMAMGGRGRPAMPTSRTGLVPASHRPAREAAADASPQPRRTASAPRTGRFKGAKPFSHHQSPGDPGAAMCAPDQPYELSNPSATYSTQLQDYDSPAPRHFDLLAEYSPESLDCIAVNQAFSPEERNPDEMNPDECDDILESPDSLDCIAVNQAFSPEERNPDEMNPDECDDILEDYPDQDGGRSLAIRRGPQGDLVGQGIDAIRGEVDRLLENLTALLTELQKRM